MTTQTKRTTKPKSQISTPILWVAGLIIIAGVVAYLLSGGDDPVSTAASGSSETASVQVTGAFLAPLTSPDPAVGQQAPTLVGQTFDGSPVEIGGDGTTRLYGFFAHWCPHCQDELPRVSAWLEANTLPEGVEVVAVSTAVDPSAANYPPSAWFAREDWPADVILDDNDQSIATAFGLTAFPFWVAVDADGEVLYRLAGSLSDTDFTALVVDIGQT